MNIWKPFQPGIRGNRETAAFVGGIYATTTQYAPRLKSRLKRECEKAAAWILLCGEMSVSPKGPSATPTSTVQSTPTLLSFFVSFSPLCLIYLNDFFLLKIFIKRWPQWEEVIPEWLLQWFISQQMASFVRACTCFRVHIKQCPYESCEEKTRNTEMEEKMVRNCEKRPHSRGCCQVRMMRPSASSLHTSCFGLNPVPAASGENRPDLFQHSELLDMDYERVVILVLASFAQTFIAFSCRGIQSS